MPFVSLAKYRATLSTVYRARLWGSPVAVKIPKAQSDLDATAVAREVGDSRICSWGSFAYDRV